MGILGDLAKAMGISSDDGANTTSAPSQNTTAGSNTANTAANSGSWSDIFSIPPTVIKTNGGAPGPICDKNCAITDSAQCVGCLERQSATVSGINELRTLERVLKVNENKSVVFVPRRMKQCARCSAPFASGKDTCEYCGAPYPDDRICGDIPDEKEKRDEFFLMKCEEAYKRFTDWEKYREKLEEVGAVGKFMGMFSKGKLESRNMTAADIKAGASGKNMTCTDYISEIIGGNIKPAAQEKRENTMIAVAGAAAAALAVSAAASVASASARSAAQPAPAPAPTYTPPDRSTNYNTLDEQFRRSREEQQERHRQVMEREMEHRRRLHEIEMEKLRIQQRAAEHRSPPAYGGGGSSGSSRCCGNCKFYAVGKCCATGTSQCDTNKNASDCCGWFSYR